ncbi:hypothetical protein RJ55_05321 [Drechmeria coniospora]|nr:hypothetical protein RJ55_05321 [Drechmeria coniospora]
MVRVAHVVSLAAVASTAQAYSGCADAVPGAYIFEFFKDSHGLDSFYEHVGRVGSLRMNLTFELFNGASVQIFDKDDPYSIATKMAENPNVQAFYPICRFQSADPKAKWTGSNPPRDWENRLTKRARANETEDTFSTHIMTQVSMLRAKGWTGKGIKIAILDTGVDYTHPALGGGFGDGYRVSFGYDVIGNAYEPGGIPVPDKDPIDTCDGHGTHVAGIIAAQDTKFGFTGVAPGATLGAYRVVDCNGSTTSDMMIAGFNMAYQNGANIITASLGFHFGWSSDPIALTVQRIVEKGVPCTISQGNMGSLGLFAVATPASGKGVTSVASFENIITPALLSEVTYNIDGGKDIVSIGFEHTATRAWNETTLQVYATSLNTTVEDDACHPLPDTTPDLSNKVVLIRRGPACQFEAKISNAAAKGAKYVIFSSSGTISGSLAHNDFTGLLAAGAVSKEVGDAWAEAIRDGKKVTVTIPDASKSNRHLVANPKPATGGAVAATTSWGPTWDMEVKPLVGAPGADILSTYPLALGGYAIHSGTSMACPMVAGIIALIAEARGTFDPVLINSLLSSTAKPQLFNDGDAFRDYYAPVSQQGGGLVQAYDAAYATTLVQPAAFSFNDTDHFIKSMTITISNVGEKEVTYALGNMPAITMYTLDEGAINAAKFPNEAVREAAVMTFSQNSVRLGPGQSASVDVRPTAPSGLNAKRLALWSGWIAVNGTDDTSLTIPYQGLTGSLHNATVLPSGNTFMAQYWGDWNYTAIPANATNTTFTVPRPGDKPAKGVGLPGLVTNLTVGSPLVTAHIVPLKTHGLPENLTTEYWGHTTIGQPYGFPLRYRHRGDRVYSWKGQLDSGKWAPAGRYKFVVRALRIFGNAEDRADWDESETMPFEINYQKANVSAHRRRWCQGTRCDAS